MNQDFEIIIKELQKPYCEYIHKLYQTGAGGWINLTDRNGTRYYIKEATARVYEFNRIIGKIIQINQHGK